MNKRSLVLELLVLAALVVLGAGVRIVLGPEMPNFAPIAAIALFAGYFFQRTALAFFAPWLSMLASDAVLPRHEWQMMLLVYFMFTLPIAFSWLLRRVVKIERNSSVSNLLTSVGALIGCSLVSSVLFFLATNFAWLPWNDLYPHTMDGLIQSYERGLPFFRNTLAGDLFFACALFGSYALAVSAGWVSTAAVVESEAVSA